MPDDNDLLTDAASPTAADAFTASDSHTFAGRPLEPFSIRRQIAAQALGNRLLSGRARIEDPVPCRRCGGPVKVVPRTGEPSVAIPACPACGGTGKVHGSYDGMFADVVTLLYLCSIPPAEVKAAVQRPSDGIESALAWAERSRIVLGSPLYAAACAVYQAILSELQRSQFAVGDSAGAEPPNG